MAKPFYAQLPLRTVVEITTTEDGMPWEVYECGHGYYAPTNPYSGVRKARRRRCHTCVPLAGLGAEAERQARQDAREGRRYV